MRLVFIKKIMKIKNKFIIKIVNLYKCYWKVFIIFVPLGILFFSKQPQFSNENFGSVIFKCENL